MEMYRTTTWLLFVKYTNYKRKYKMWLLVEKEMIKYRGKNQNLLCNTVSYTLRDGLGLLKNFSKLNYL